MADKNTDEVIKNICVKSFVDSLKTERYEMLKKNCVANEIR